MRINIQARRITKNMKNGFMLKQNHEFFFCVSVRIDDAENINVRPARTPFKIGWLNRCAIFLVYKCTSKRKIAY